MSYWCLCCNNRCYVDIYIAGVCAVCIGCVDVVGVATVDDVVDYSDGDVVVGGVYYVVVITDVVLDGSVIVGVAVSCVVDSVVGVVGIVDSVDAIRRVVVHSVACVVGDNSVHNVGVADVFGVINCVSVVNDCDIVVFVGIYDVRHI